MGITSVEHVQLAMPEGQEDVARSFYCDLLGFREVPRPSTLANRGGAWFEIGTAKVHLGVEEDFRPARKAHPALVVDAIDELAARLKEAGFDATFNKELPGVRRFFTNDPFGNRIEFIEANPTTKPLQFEGLASSRLRLRAPTLHDADAVYEEYAADPEVPRYMTWVPHKERETVFEFVQGAIDRIETGEEYSWAITRPDNNRLIGMISARPVGHMSDIGYVLGRKYWGRGYMTEAVSALSDWVLAHPDLYRVWAVCDVDNGASARVLEKSGFVREGVLHRYMMHPNQSSEPRDCIAYARVK